MSFAQSDTTMVPVESVTVKPKVKNSEYQSLFKNENKAFGGYFGLNSHYTKINDQDAFFMGAELTAVINHSFNIGLQGYGLVTANQTDRTTEFGDPLYLAIGYGGLLLEPVAYYGSVVHLSFPVLLGGGGIAEYSKNYYGYYAPPYYYEETYDYFFVVEPGINVELNVLKFMRISTGASYRVTSDINLIGMKDHNLNGLNFDFSLKFGWF
jgi:hypothetical protein